jgi:hypothetical protein
MYLELQAELEQLISPLAENDLASEAESETFGVPSCPRNASFVVSGFPRCRDDVASLPKEERQKLSAIAELMVPSYRPGWAHFLQAEVLGTDDSGASALAGIASAPV